MPQDVEQVNTACAIAHYRKEEVMQIAPKVMLKDTLNELFIVEVTTERVCIIRALPLLRGDLL